MAGTSIKIFLVDGTTTGLRTAEVGMSTVKAVAAPRGSLEALGKRAESRRTGIYVLVGEDPDSPGRLAIYVGEGDDAFARIAAHDKDEAKDFFDRVLLFVSKDDNLNKAHVRYIEGRLVALAKEAKRCTVMNGTEPSGGSLSETDLADMDTFLAQLRLLASTLGVPAFEPALAIKSTAPNDAAPKLVDYELTISGEGYSAECVVVDGEYVVTKGSVARLAEAGSLPKNIVATRKELENSGVLQRNATGLTFTQDYAFASASTSAQVVSGTTVNGRAVWRLKENGETLKDWTDRMMAALASVATPAESQPS